MRELRVWLTDDLCPVIEDYVGRPRFQKFACWPLQALTEGAETPDRQLIVAVDGTIVAMAKTLSELSTDPAAREQLDKQNLRKGLAVEELVEIGANSCRRLGIRSEQVNVLQVGLNQVSEIAGRPWKDLVCATDYFEPEQEWNDSDDGHSVQRAELIVSANPELHAIGNFVVRGLLQRIDSICAPLEMVRGWCLTALAGMPKNWAERRQRIESQWDELQQQVARLRAGCVTGSDNHLRESCIILTQVYAAFHPAPDMAWLGLPDAVIREGANVLRVRLQQFDSAEMIERIAAAVVDLAQLYKDCDVDLSARDEAIAGGGLVIDVGQVNVFWEGLLVGEDLKGRPWDLLVALARKAKLRAQVEERDLQLDDGRSDSFMPTNRNRLKLALPAGLDQLIVRGNIPRSYRLKLEPQRIHIIERKL
ncbi:MAG: hypothetical protein HY290_03655 [Planctomycetia bacterium]|nr:hypothetical protein [Planctomycetia bacterium]